MDITPYDIGHPFNACNIVLQCPWSWQWMPSSPCSTKPCGCVPCCHLFQLWGTAYVSKTKWDTQLREGPEWRHRGNSPRQRTEVLCHSVPIYVSMSLLVTSVSYCLGIVMCHHFCDSLQCMLLFRGKLIYWCFLPSLKCVMWCEKHAAVTELRN